MTSEPEADSLATDSFGMGATKSAFWRPFWEILHDLSVAILFCFFLITFVAQVFRVEGTSMQPLLQDGERILVNKLTYRFSPITRGDVVVFWYPRDPSVSFIKRVVGVPGDVVQIRRGQLFVNDAAVTEGYVQSNFQSREDAPATEVRPGFYYVLGDHRTSSSDSRSWGEVPEKYIYGRASFRFWPLSKIGPIH